MRKILIVILFLCPVMVLGAGPAQSANGGHHIGTGVMALSSSTQQGGQGPIGSTLLTHTEYLYNFSYFALGMFYLMDKQGSAETDTAYGPKVELYFGAFYIDAGYAVAVNRAYTDRSIANDTGTGMYYGVGTRFNLGAGGPGSAGFYFFANYKSRTYTINKQDGVEISEKIIQKDNYPIFGLGLHF
jgi:hypothetical protein